MSQLGRLKSLVLPERRSAVLRARYYLRHAQVGSNALVVGRPMIENRATSVGDDLLLWSKAGRTTFLLGAGNLTIGNRVFINSGVTIDAAQSVVIGDDVALAYDVFISDTTNHGVEGAPPRIAPVVIGAGSWIQLRASVMPGVTIGRRCVIGAHSVVTSNIPDDTFAAGVPAKPIHALEYPTGCVRAWTD